MLLEITSVTKEYRAGVRANDEISISVDAGEVFGLLGPNGAGKTTLVSQLLGLLRPTSGSIRIDGVDVVADPRAARRLCSYQPQAAAQVEGLTARQAVQLAGRIRGGRAAEVRRRGDALLEALDLDDIADRRVPMSGGMARLVGFCMAAVQPGRVVVLDEPTNDVDPLRRRRLWQQVRALADDGAAVLLVTHNVLEAERCVDRLAIVDRGRVVATGTAGRLKAELGAPLRLECTLEPGSVELAPPASVAVVNQTPRRLLGHVQLAHAGDAVSWAKGAQDSGEVVEFALAPASLEDVYASWVEVAKETPA